MKEEERQERRRVGGRKGEKERRGEERSGREERETGEGKVDRRR